MAYVITEPCIEVKDKSCVNVCPVDCIYEDESSPMLFINPDECIDCSACQTQCPVSAIFAQADVPVRWHNFTYLNALYFTDPEAVREKLKRP